MRRLLISLFFVSILATGVPGVALADKVGVSGTHSEQEIMTACGKAKGGVPYTDDNGTYGCQADGGSIKCTNGKCEGECRNCGPAIAHGKHPVVGVLSGTTLKAGANSTTKTTVRPTHIKTPVANSNLGGVSNNETHQGKKK